MKTSKTNTAGRSKKTSATGKTIKSGKINTTKSSFSENEIREKAKEIYLQRIGRGEHGTELDDWLKAEALLKKSNKK
jgi:hypothetical protein